MRGSAFFDGVAQAEMSFDGQPARLPIFYYDGNAMSAVFPARLAALRRLMPDPRIVPARLAPGVGAVAVTCFEYLDTDIGPYNELAISVILADGGANLPGVALLSSLRRRQLHAYVWHLPVTTEIANVNGRELWGYPKFVADIDFTQDGPRRVCRLSEHGEHILTLVGDRIETPRSERVRLFSHLWAHGQPQGSEFAINAVQLGLSHRPGVAELTLGEHHPIAAELGDVLLSRSPIEYHYVPGFEGILYGPDRVTAPLLEVFARRMVGGRWMVAQ
jgi:hypothetical protein